MPRPVFALAATNVILSLVAIAVFLFRYLVLHRHDVAAPGWGYYYYWPIGRHPHFPDIIFFVERFKHLHTPEFFSNDPRVTRYEAPFMYPAAAAFLYAFFYAFPHAVNTYLHFIVLCVVSLGALFAYALVTRGIQPILAIVLVTACTIFSYPFWFAYGTANVEFCIFLLLLGGVAAFSTRHKNVAAFLFGLAAGMKIFPFVFVALFLARKQYKQIVLAGVVALLSNVAGLWMVCPSIAYSYKQINAGLDVNRQVYMLQVLRLETSFDHSIFGLLKRLAAAHGIWHMPPKVLTGYMAFVASTGLVLYFAQIRKLPVLNQITCLYVIAILFPPTSHDYTLIHLYVPWALLVLYIIDSRRVGIPTPNMMPGFLCLAVAFASENELVFHRMGFSAQVKCVALMAFLVISLTQRWDWPRLQANTDFPEDWEKVPPRRVFFLDQPDPADEREPTLAT